MPSMDIFELNNKLASDYGFAGEVRDRIGDYMIDLDSWISFDSANGSSEARDVQLDELDIGTITFIHAEEVDDLIWAHVQAYAVASVSYLVERDLVEEFPEADVQDVEANETDAQVSETVELQITYSLTIEDEQSVAEIDVLLVERG